MRPLLRKAAMICVFVAVASACSKEQPLDLKQAAAGAKDGGNLVIGISEPQSIDPGTVSAFDASGSLVVRTMCDTLIQFDPISGEPKPAIAESWQVLEGGARITVKIRKGVRFHSGEEVTAEDVAYSLARVVVPETASPVAEFLSPIEGFQDLHAGLESPDDQGQSELSGIQIIDNYSFEITLDRRQADFVRVLGHPLAVPVPKKVASKDPDAFASNPVCAGPYRLAEPWTTGKPVIKLTRFSDYYGKNLGYTKGGAGWADSIELRVNPDREGQFKAFQSGSVDVAGVPQTRLGEAKVLGQDFVETPGPLLEYIGLPVTVLPFDRRALRVAFRQALDRQRIVDVVFAGARAPAGGILPPTLGKDLYRNGACGANAPLKSDVSKARASLAAARVSLEGKPLKLYFNDEFMNRQLMENVAEQWRAAFALVPELVPMEWAQYLAKGTGQPGFDGPFRMAWASQYPSADAYLRPLLESSNAGQDNLTRFSNREFDSTLQRDASRALAEEDRNELYKVLEETACGEMPIIPIAFGSTHHLVRTGKIGSASERFTDTSTGQIVVRELYLK